MHVVLRGEQGLQCSLITKFSSAYRLLRRDGFNHVIRAEALVNKDFKVFFVVNDKDNARLGIVVGKKTLSGSADRNRLKRIIRETFRHHSIMLCKLDVVVMVRRSFSEKSKTQTDNLKILLTKVENRCAEF